MRKTTLITGLDIGSSKIAAVAAEIDRTGISSILAQATGPSKGVSKGVIVGMDEAARSVSAVLTKLADKISRKPGDIYVNASGAAVKAERSEGMIPLSLRGREVTKADINRCVEASSTIRLPFDREILHRIVRNFSVDGQPCIKDPLGLYASRLACEVYIITADTNHIQNIYKCVNFAGCDVREIVFTGIADGAGLLTRPEKDSGALLLDIGSSLTELSLFFEGALNEMAVLDVGAEELRGDFSQTAGLTTLLGRINSMRDNFLSAGGKITSIVVTGGMAFTDGFIEFLEERLSLPVRMGVARDIRGDISSLDSVRIATAIGLVKYACDRHKVAATTYKNIPQLVSAKVVDLFNNYF